MKKSMTMLYMTVVLTVGLFLSASAAHDHGVPNDSYTYWKGTGSPKAVYTRPMYTVREVITARTTGTTAFEQLTDVCADPWGRLYLLDGKASRLVITDSEHKFLREITSINLGGKETDFTGAKGVYVHSNGDIYLSDTNNQRVLVMDEHGKTLDVFLKPDSVLIPEEYQFKPLKVEVDSKGYTYILSDGSYYGAMLYAPDKTFMGFYGANSVRNGLLGTLENLWNRIFMNNIKRAQINSRLPYCFSDISIDSEGFVYTATGFTDKTQQSEQLRRLNPGLGKNILPVVNFADAGHNTSFLPMGILYQDMTGIAVDGDGFFFGLDSVYGKVFIYHKDNGLLSVFGGGMKKGSQVGSFQLGSAIAVSGTDILICDSVKNTITIFKETEYGTLVRLACKTRAESDWAAVLALDKNCQQAYSGIARTSLERGDTHAALEYAHQGFDREIYALAFKEVRHDFLSKYFLPLFLGAILLIGAILTAVMLSMRRKVSVIKNPCLKLMVSVPFHPVDSFTDLKEKNLGSVKLSTLLLLTFYILSISEVLLGGFLFTYLDTSGFNSLLVLVRSVGLVVLWTVINWAVCSLFEGKGRLNEIFTVACYSLIPMMAGQILYIVLSNIMLPAEAEFLGILKMVTLLYTLLLITIGTVKIHDFEGKRFIGTTALTIFGIAVAVFLMIMVGILVQQFAAFIGTLTTELTS